MAVSEVEVRRIAALSRLRLEDAEVRRLAIDLSSILRHVEALAAADSGESRGDRAVVDWSAPFRDPGAGADDLHRPPAVIAPDWRDGFFVVPRLPGLEGAAGEDPGA